MNLIIIFQLNDYFPYSIFIHYNRHKTTTINITSLYKIQTLKLGRQAIKNPTSTNTKKEQQIGISQTNAYMYI